MLIGIKCTNFAHEMHFKVPTHTLIKQFITKNKEKGLFDPWIRLQGRENPLGNQTSLERSGFPLHKKTHSS